MQVAALFRYPVKSLRGVEVAELELGPRGPRHDREWMLVDAHDRFLTQRSRPALARLSARLDGESLVLSDDEGAVLEAPSGRAPRRVVVWRDTVDALDCGDEAARWLEGRVGQACRLVRFAPSAVRPLDPAFSPAPSAQTGFADAYPVLLTTAGSLEALNGWLEAPIGMERFRPNVVVTGSPAWAEDGWRVLQVGGVVFDLVKPCARCVVITTDQRTGERPDAERPLSVLARERTLRPFGAIFGENAVHRAEGWLRVGDEVRVLERRPPPRFEAR